MLNNGNDDRTVFFSPISALFKSRKVMVAAATLIVNVAVVLIPALEPAQTVLLAAVTAVGGVLIGSIAHEDAAEKS